MSTPSPHRPTIQTDSPRTSTPTGDSTLTLQRHPAHAKYPLTPSRFGATTTPSGSWSISRYTPRGRAPATPYGLRAIQRRAANTPGRDRRRSGRIHRESTFDVLRNLGRVLAPVSKPIQSSPHEPTPEPPKETWDEIDELDNEPEVERPRLSLPLQEVEEAEEGSPDMPPPRISLAFDEEDITHGSIEYPRRDISDRDRARLSTVSYGGFRPSENFGDLTRLGSDPEEDETGVVAHEQGEGPDETLISQGAFDRGGETEDLGRFHFDFNFPSPNAQDLGNVVGEAIHDDEGFELPEMGLQPGTQSDAGLASAADDDASDDFGPVYDAPHVSPSESPRIVGGGLHEESFPKEPKRKKLSRHGIPVPNLPSGVVKKIASRFAPTKAGSRGKINKPTLAALEQATSWFFEQISEDLEAYSKHAARKTIDESDILTLMKRQRLINSSTTPFSLGQKHLPKELLQDMRFANPP